MLPLKHILTRTFQMPCPKKHLSISCPFKNNYFLILLVLKIMFQLACSLETDPEMIFLTTFMLGNIFSEYIARYRHISQASLSLTFSYICWYFIVLSYSAKTQITKSCHCTPYLIMISYHNFFPPSIT